MADTGVITVSEFTGRKAAPTSGVTSGGSQLNVSEIVINWQSDGSGNAVKASLFSLSGFPWRVLWIPGTPAPGGTPTLTLTDAYGFDLLSGQGASLSASVKKEIGPMMTTTDGTTAGAIPRLVSSLIDFNLSGAVGVAVGKVVIYTR